MDQLIIIGIKLLQEEKKEQTSPINAHPVEGENSSSLAKFFFWDLDIQETLNLEWLHI